MALTARVAGRSLVGRVVALLHRRRLSRRRPVAGRRFGPVRTGRRRRVRLRRGAGLALRRRRGRSCRRRRRCRRFGGRSFGAFVLFLDLVDLVLADLTRRPSERRRRRVDGRRVGLRVGQSQRRRPVLLLVLELHLLEPLHDARRVHESRDAAERSASGVFGVDDAAAFLDFGRTSRWVGRLVALVVEADGSSGGFVVGIAGLQVAHETRPEARAATRVGRRDVALVVAVLALAAAVGEPRVGSVTKVSARTFFVGCRFRAVLLHVALFRLPELRRHPVVAFAAHQTGPQRRRLRRLRGAGRLGLRDGQLAQGGQGVGQLIGILRDEEAHPAVVVARLALEAADELHGAQEDLLGVEQFVVVPDGALAHVLLGELGVAVKVGDLLVQVVLELRQMARLFGQKHLDLALEELGAVLERLGQPVVDVVDLLDDVGAVGLQVQRVLLDDAERVRQPRQRPAHLIVDACDFPPQDVQVGVFAVGTDAFVAVTARADVGLLRANPATFHDLPTQRFI